MGEGTLICMMSWVQFPTNVRVAYISITIIVSTKLFNNTIRILQDPEFINNVCFYYKRGDEEGRMGGLRRT